ncbi:MAG: hypothetical protein ACPK7O_06250 [Methanobacterium sp.]
MIKNLGTFEYKTVIEKNFLYEKAFKNRLPFFGIGLVPEYGFIIYDMKTSPAYLNEKAVRKLGKIFNEMIYLDVVLDSNHIHVEEEKGISPIIPFNICKEYAFKVAEIVYNRQNWIIDYFELNLSNKN